MKIILATLGLALSTGLAHAAAVESSFTASSEGWTGITFSNVAVNWTSLFGTDSPYALTQVASGGNPGGYVSFADPNEGDSYFVAPSAYLGNLSSFAGGSLSFSRRDIQNGGSPYVNPLVALVSGGTVIVNGGAAPTLAPTWSEYDFTLAAGAWRFNDLNGALVSAAEFAAVLGNVTALYISAEAWSPVVEVSHLDSVRLASPVPVPAALWLLGSGLATVAARARRR